RNFDHIEPVNLGKFGGFGKGGAGHAGEFRGKAEIVLESDGSERLVLALYGHAFLGFNSLMQPIRIAAAFYYSAGEFVDDDALVVLDDVIDIASKQFVRAQCLIDMMDDLYVLRIVKPAARR